MMEKCAVVVSILLCLNLVISLSCLAGGFLAASDGLTVAPNPFIPNDGNENTGSWESGVTFNNQGPEVAEVGIYTLAGELLAEGTLPTRGEWVWDGRNQEGNKGASGIYLYIVTGPSGEKLGKLIVIT